MSGKDKEEQLRSLIRTTGLPHGSFQVVPTDDGADPTVLYPGYFETWEREMPKTDREKLEVLTALVSNVLKQAKEDLEMLIRFKETWK